MIYHQKQYEIPYKGKTLIGQYVHIDRLLSSRNDGSCHKSHQVTDQINEDTIYINDCKAFFLRDRHAVIQIHLPPVIQIRKSLHGDHGSQKDDNRPHIVRKAQCIPGRLIHRPAKSLYGPKGPHFILALDPA